MHKNIEDVEFTIFDTETTGLSPEAGDRIVEIAAVRFKGEKTISGFQSLVYSGRQVSPGAFAVNHISPEMLRGAPAMSELMPKFLDFIRGSCLCSYNAGFDLGFLNQELRLLGLPALDHLMAVDILKMARRLLPGLPRHPLWLVAESLGLDDRQEHRASSDVELTLSTFRKLKAILLAKGKVDFPGFLHLFAFAPRLLDDLNNQKSSRIQEAIDLKMKLKIRYLAASNAEITQREVVPKEVRKERNAIYLVGYCCLRKEERSFRLDSILEMESA